IAENILTALKEHPESWTRVDTILEYSQNQQTKYYALQILENVIKTRWKVLPRNQCDGNFLVMFLIQLFAFNTNLTAEKTYLGKLNMILVQILKQDWPKNWPTFISDIVGASRTNESLCQNNMVILKLLSEEVFDFSQDQMTQVKAKHLKDSMCNEFSDIFQLCQFVMVSCVILTNDFNAPLVNATLSTLLCFLNWIPLGYIFETELITQLIYKFLNLPMFRNVTLKCITEIGEISCFFCVICNFKMLYLQLGLTLFQMLPPNVNMKAAYASGSDTEQNFIQNLALFLCTFLKEHGQLVEKEDLRPNLVDALGYLVHISEVEETEIFKICLEYWNSLSAELYRENPFSPTPTLIASTDPIVPARRQIYLPILSRVSWSMVGITLLKAENSNDIKILPCLIDPTPTIFSLLYVFETANIFCQADFIYQKLTHTLFKWANINLNLVRLVMISRMAKPEEVLVVENEQGEVVREFMKDTDSINLYKNMRETLVYLTHLDYVDTERIMTEKLHNQPSIPQVNGSEWSWKNLNTLCWAIGSISGAMHEEDEKRFLVTVIRDLLGLCEMKRGKDNKAIIASNIMYVVGQYPRFLRAHWRFLKTVVNKLFEFMHETHDGVQDMACDTFIKIAQKCRRHFVQMQAGEVMPFIEEILSNISTIICDLQPQQLGTLVYESSFIQKCNPANACENLCTHFLHLFFYFYLFNSFLSQVHTFYEAVGFMISAQTDSVWDNIIQKATKDVDILKDPATVKQLGSILKTNVRAGKAVGHSFVQQLGRIYLDMLNVYKCLSENISSAIQQNGEGVMKQPLIRSMRTVKKETLKLNIGLGHYNSAQLKISMISLIMFSLSWSFLYKPPLITIRFTSLSSHSHYLQVAENFVPPLLEAVLIDYRSNVPAAREPEVLSTIATIVNKLEGAITKEIGQIFDAVFECTLEMINKDFEEFPEYRTNFFLLLQAVNNHCFPALLSIPQPQFKLVLDSIIWAFKHTMRNVAHTGLSILYQLLQNITSVDDAAQSFYQMYFTDILQHVFSVGTDTSHTAGISFVLVV
uniref:Exportin-1 n=1 Tax=Ciona savignyi TaxID=51511 RepID=H2YXR4_CIOSA